MLKQLQVTSQVPVLFCVTLEETILEYSTVQFTRLGLQVNYLLSDNKLGCILLNKLALFTDCVCTVHALSTSYLGIWTQSV